MWLTFEFFVRWDKPEPISPRGELMYNLYPPTSLDRSQEWPRETAVRHVPDAARRARGYGRGLAIIREASALGGAETGLRIAAFTGNSASPRHRGARQPLKKHPDRRK